MSNFQHAIIKLHYKEKVYESIPLDLNIKEYGETIYDLSTHGTNDRTILKFPTSETSEMIISKYQLDESLIEICLVEKKKTRSKKTESINS